METKAMKTQSEVCLSCLECCKVIAFPYPSKLVTKTFIEFYKTRGCNLVWDSKTVFVVVKEPCQHLTELGCDIYNSRPVACRMYNGLEDPIVAKKCKLRNLEQYKNNEINRK